MATASSLLTGVAFITGAGSGIGRETAVAFVKNGITKLGLSDINLKSLDGTAQLINDINSDVEVELIEANVSKEDEVKGAIEKTVQRFGRLDIAVNNAGIGIPPAPTNEAGLEDWQRCLAVNTTGVFLCQKYETAQMLKQEDQGYRRGRGVIVNVASMLGLVGVSRHVQFTAYVSSKHAVMGLTKSDGAFFANKGIRINAICPGFVETPVLMDVTRKSDVMESQFSKVPLQRLAKAEEIADGIVFLSSTMSSYIVGSGLVVDGGYTAI